MAISIGLLTSAIAPSPSRAAKVDLTCDAHCLVTGAWAAGQRGIDPDAGIGVGNVVAINDGVWTIDFGGRTVEVRLAEFPEIDVPNAGLEIGGLDPDRMLGDDVSQSIAYHQPIRVEGGTAPLPGGAIWTGAQRLRLNWWQGLDSFFYGKSSGQAFGVLVGSVVRADSDGLQLSVDGRDIWVAAYPNSLTPQVLADAEEALDALDPGLGGYRYSPTLFGSYQRVLVWFDPDRAAPTNPRAEGRTEGDASCQELVGAECRWAASRVYVLPSEMRPEPAAWWDAASYAWSNVFVGALGVVVGCSQTSEAVGRVVSVDRSSQTIAVIAGGQRIETDRPPGSPLPIVGEIILIRGHGCIDNGRILEPRLLIIAPRDETGGLVAIASSTRLLRIKAERGPIPVAQKRSSNGVDWDSPITRVAVDVEIDGAPVAPVAGTLQIMVDPPGWVEASAPGAESVTAAQVRHLEAGARITPWSMRILKRPPATESQILTVTLRFIESNGASATGSAEIELGGGTYPAPRSLTGDGAFMAMIAGLGWSIADGLMVTQAGGTAELVIAPEGRSEGAFNWATFGCGPDPECLKESPPGIVWHRSPESAGVRLSVPDTLVGVTFLYHHSEVREGESWGGLDLSVSGLLYDRLGVTAFCGILSCELPELTGRWIRLDDQDPLAKAEGAQGYGWVRQIKLGLSIEPDLNITDLAEHPGSGVLPALIRSFDLLENLRAIRLDRCTEPAVVIPYQAKEAVLAVGSCTAQLSPQGVARVLKGYVMDPDLQWTQVLPGIKQTLAWVVAGDPANAAIFSAELMGPAR